jgi:hypothetical protein
MELGMLDKGKKRPSLNIFFFRRSLAASTRAD